MKKDKKIHTFNICEVYKTRTSVVSYLLLIFILLLKTIKYLSYQSPNIIPVQSSVPTKPIIRVLINTLQQTPHKMIRHLHPSPGHLHHDVPHDPQGH